MNLHLEDQVVLITGSTRGIGKGVAEAFLQEGARVVLTGLDSARLQATEASFREKYGVDKVLGFVGDLQQEDQVEALAEWLEGKVGELDHLICNIGTGRSVPPLQEDEAEWKRILDINLLTAAGCVRRLLPLLERGAARSPAARSIILISSICGVEALGCPLAYAAAKSALIAYGKNLARPLGTRGIRVNVVSPGNVLFPGSTWEDKLARDRQAVEAMLQREVPLGRLGTAAEVANVVVFVASSRAAFVTGANLVVDGGQTRTH